jgi:hypothetical protein
VKKKKKRGIQKCISIGNPNTADTDSPQMPRNRQQAVLLPKPQDAIDSSPKNKESNTINPIYPETVGFLITFLCANTC